MAQRPIRVPPRRPALSLPPLSSLLPVPRSLTDLNTPASAAEVAGAGHQPLPAQLQLPSALALGSEAVSPPAPCRSPWRAEGRSHAPGASLSAVVAASEEVSVQVLCQDVPTLSQPDPTHQNPHGGAALLLQVLSEILLHLIKPSETSQKHSQQGKELSGKTRKEMELLN